MTLVKSSEGNMLSMFKETTVNIWLQMGSKQDKGWGGTLNQLYVQPSRDLLAS